MEYAWPLLKEIGDLNLSRIFVVGIGPGRSDMMTGEAISALSLSDTIVGYNVYLNLLPEDFSEKEMISTPMTKEIERCRICFEEAKKGKTVSMISSGDAGVYGMASLMYEISGEYPGIEIHVVPGITAALSGAALLGAPLSGDFCLISLSDLLTPWEIIKKRIEAAVMGDFVMVLYNPSSKKRADYLNRACSIIEKVTDRELVCGFAQNIGREKERVGIMPLSKLKDFEADMFTTVFIGNSNTLVIDGKMVTKRGYRI